MLFFACTKDNQEAKIKTWKAEVVSAEEAFASMAAEQGVETAFVAFADENAVMNRNENIIKGLPAIKDYFANNSYSGVKLEWKPDFVEVASSGDLAYTYGHYTFSVVDSTGITNSSQGIFHTVWKKQTDGSWKFVWD